MKNGKRIIAALFLIAVVLIGAGTGIAYREMMGLTFVHATDFPKEFNYKTKTMHLDVDPDKTFILPTWPFHGEVKIDNKLADGELRFDMVYSSNYRKLDLYVDKDNNVILDSDFPSQDLIYVGEALKPMTKLIQKNKMVVDLSPLKIDVAMNEKTRRHYRSESDDAAAPESSDEAFQSMQITRNGESITIDIMRDGSAIYHFPDGTTKHVNPDDMEDFEDMDVDDNVIDA